MNSKKSESQIDQSTLNLFSAIARWLKIGDSGVSSEAMIYHLTGLDLHSSCQHPIDANDFGRCERLLSSVPGLRERLPKMAEVSSQWAALVARWPELAEAYYRPGLKPSLSTLIREILASA